MWRVHEKLGGATANGRYYADNAIVGVGSRPMHREGVGVQAVWPTIALIRDPYTGAKKRRDCLDRAGALGLQGPAETESFFRVTTNNA